nr:methionyl-tRNA formyltransferase [Bacillota bacterium]
MEQRTTLSAGNSSNKLRLIFMGTPDFAVPSLRALFNSQRYEMMCVTQPDQPSGRGLRLRPCACKIVAQELGLDVFSPERVSRREPRAVLADFEPDFIVTVAFGQLLKESVLNIPKIACVNLHPSLLPKYRGPSPINWPIIRGEKETGVTTMLMDKGMDTGDILLQKATPIGDDETAAELYSRLAQMGAELLLETLAGLANNTIVPKKQDHERATYAPKLTKRDGLIDWSKDPATLVNYVRGLVPWPGTYTYYMGRILKISKLRHVEAPPASPERPAGTIVAASPKDGLIVKTKPDAVSVELLQPPGRRQMTAKEFLAGHQVKVGQRLSRLIE